MTTGRTETADLLKGIAVVLMIQVHIIELFASEGIYNSGIGKLLLFMGGPPVAPVFMVILGYFIAASKKKPNQLIIRGLKIIALGMLLNLAMNLNLIISVNKGLFQIDLLPYIFGVDILQFAGISIIIIAILKKAFEKSLIFVFAGIILSAFLGHFLLNFVPNNLVLKYFSSLFYGSSKWSYFPVFPWLSYPLAGIAFYQLKLRFDFNFLNETKTKLLLGILFVVFFIFTMRYAISISSELPLYYHHGLIFVLWTLVFLSFYSLFMNEINHFAGRFILFRYLKWLGENVTFIYIIQWIIIGNTATEIYKTVSSPLCLVIYFVAVLLIASSVCNFSIWIKGRLLKKVA